MALATGLGPTAVGYFIQGFFKFGGVEIIKVKATEQLGTKKVRYERDSNLGEPSVHAPA